MGLKDDCSLVMSAGASWLCLLGFLDRLLLLLPDRYRWGILILSARGHCKWGMCNLGLPCDERPFTSYMSKNVRMQSGGERPVAAICAGAEVDRLGVACAARNRDVLLGKDKPNE